MSYFPFYLDITNKTFLIIGGGPVALEKVSRLRRFTEDIIRGAVPARFRS